MNTAPARGKRSGSGSPSSSLTRDQAVAGLEVVDGILGCLCGISKALPDEEELAELLLVEWGSGSEESVDKAVDLLTSKGGALTEKEVAGLLKVIDDSLAGGFVANVEKGLPDILTKAYKRAKKEAARKLAMAEIDKKATTWLAEHHIYWVGGYFDKHLSDELKAHVIEGMKEGLGRAEIGRQLKEFFEDYPGIANRPDVYWRGLAANGINRSRQFGHVQGYVDLGVKELEVIAVMDERTSPICRQMNGKIIPVAECAAQRDALMGIDDPELVKELSPWVSAKEIEGKSVKQINDMGVVMPPYHFHCRTELVER